MTNSTSGAPASVTCVHDDGSEHPLPVDKPASLPCSQVAEPEQTDNSERPEDGEQDVSQSTTFDYSEGPEVTE